MVYGSITRTFELFGEQGSDGGTNSAGGTKGQGYNVGVEIEADYGTKVTFHHLDGGAGGTNSRYNNSNNSNYNGGNGGGASMIRNSNGEEIAASGGGGGGGSNNNNNNAGNGGNAGFRTEVGGTSVGATSGTGADGHDNPRPGGGTAGNYTSSYNNGGGGSGRSTDGSSTSLNGSSGTSSKGGDGGSATNYTGHTDIGGGGGGAGYRGGGGGGANVDGGDNEEGSGGGGGGLGVVRNLLGHGITNISVNASYCGNSTASHHNITVYDSAGTMVGNTYGSGNPDNNGRTYIFAGATVLSDFTVTVDKNTLPFSINFSGHSNYYGFHNSDPLIISGDKSLSIQKYASNGGTKIGGEILSGVYVNYNLGSSIIDLSKLSHIPSGTQIDLDFIEFTTSINNNESYTSNLATLSIVLIGGDDIDLSSNVSTAASTTNFTTSTGADLNTIFQPISLGTQISYNTGFQVSGTDLKGIFAAKTSAAGSATGFEVSGNDLNTIFEPINLTKKLIVDTATSGSTVFPVLSGEKMTVILVGGGGGGSSNARNASINPTSSTGGNGGAGGEIFIKNDFSAGTTYTINYSIGAGGTGSTTENVAGGTGGSSTVTIDGTTYTASGGAGGHVSYTGIGSQGTTGDDYNYNHGGTSAVKNLSGDTYIDSTDGQGGFVLTVDGTAYNVGGGGAGGANYHTGKDEAETNPGIGGGVWRTAGINGGGGGGGSGNINGIVSSHFGGNGGAGFLCIVVHS